MAKLVAYETLAEAVVATSAVGLVATAASMPREALAAATRIAAVNVSTLAAPAAASAAAATEVGAIDPPQARKSLWPTTDGG